MSLPENHPAQPRCSRRMFLLASGSSLAAVLLAACGESSETVSADQVPVGSAIIVGDIIIAQPTAGTFAAYSTTCPHQGSAINFVDGDEVECPAHRSRFRIDDGGPVAGPARSPLSTVPVTREGDRLTAGAKG